MYAVRQDAAVVCTNCNHAKWLLVSRNGRGIEYMCQKCGVLGNVHDAGLHLVPKDLAMRQWVPRWASELVALHTYCTYCHQEDRQLMFKDWLNSIIAQQGRSREALGFVIMPFEGVTLGYGENLKHFTVFCSLCAARARRTIRRYLKNEYMLKRVRLL